MSRLQQLVDELVTIVRPGPISLDMEMTKGGPGGAVGIYSLALGAVRAAATGLQLWASGNHLGAMLSFRFTWEAAITSQWLANTGTGAEALINEQSRWRRLILDEAPRGTAYLKQAADAAAGPEIEELFTAVQAGGQHFLQRCLTFNDGWDLYVTYRLFSTYCHPGAGFIDEWLDALSDDDVRVRDVAKLDATTLTAWPATGVVAAMWAASSFDCHLKDRPHRSRLSAIAKELDPPDCLQPSPKAVQREVAALETAQRETRTRPAPQPGEPRDPTM